jgi:dipeptide/tripeptide permease
MGTAQVKLLHWLTGISLGIGLLVLLNQLQIGYYLYYPRTTTTVLISGAFDLYLFLASSLCVPLALALRPRKFSIPATVGLIAVWLVALILTILNQSLAVVILYAVVICTTALNVTWADGRREAVSEILPSALVVLVLVEASCVFYWVGAALNPHAMVGFMAEQNEANLTFALYPLAIPILLLLMFSWLWIPLLTRPPNPTPRNKFTVRYQPSTSKLSKRSVAASLR